MITQEKSLYRAKGFTLVEIMVVVVIVGILAALLIPAANKSNEKSHSTVLVNNLVKYTDAFELYNTEFGDWPPTAGLNQIPLGMEDFLPANYTTSAGPGSGYMWQKAQSTLRLLKPNASLEVMVQIDQLLDDGDLSSGRFQKKGAMNYDYQLE